MRGIHLRLGEDVVVPSVEILRALDPPPAQQVDEFLPVNIIHPPGERNGQGGAGVAVRSAESDKAVTVPGTEETTPPPVI